MNLARFVNKLFNKQILNDPDKCRVCEYLLCVSNHSTCYECRGTDKFEKNTGAVRSI